MKAISAGNSMRMAAMATALLVAGGSPFVTHAQNDSKGTIQLITGGGKVTLQTAEGSSNSTCTATSTERAVAVALGGRCSSFGTSADLPEHFYVKITDDQLTFREGGRSYVIRDGSAIASARELFEPVRDAMKKQADMGRQMNELGAKERGTSADFREARVSVPDLGAEFRKVEAEAKRLSAAGGTQSELSELQSELSELQSRISQLQSEASEAKAQADEERSELGLQVMAMNQQMQAASAEMNVWNSQQEEATAQAARQVKAFLDQAIANGTAKPE